MKLLHLGSPGHQLGSFEHTRVIESADLDEHGCRREFRACGQLDSASLAEMSGRRPRAILLVEGSRGAFGKLETLGVNRHEEIAAATRNLLTRQAVAQTSHQCRPFALIADVTAVASTRECKFGIHESCFCPKPKV